MKSTIKIRRKKYKIDFSKPIDISIPIHNGENQLKCFYANDVSFEPVKAGDFIGSLKEGGPVNFYTIQINPHGNGTHTECCGHILDNDLSINQCLKSFHFLAQLITLEPKLLPNGDRVFQLDSSDTINLLPDVEALVIRTLPNGDFKKRTNYSGQNAPYFHPELMQVFVDAGIRHLLIDLPSVDKEQDGGALSAHHTFWQTETEPRLDATITEMVYIDDSISDGIYVLNLQIISLELDASPSKPVLYGVKS